METKTFCSACKVHCYKPEMREQIRTVMRWSGPLMPFCPPRAGHPAYEGNDEGEEELGVSKTRTALDEPDAVRVFVW